MNAPHILPLPTLKPPAVATLSKASMRHWTGTKDEFISFLLYTLVPDLRASGADMTADDFESAVWFMCGGD
jgi:hypothetical protein